MKRKLSAALACLLLLLVLPVAALADEVPPLVVDNAGLLTDAERLALTEKSLTALREQYQMDVVILTVNSLEGQSLQDYADDFYDNHGYGCPNNGSGLLFLLSMEERDWYISTYGDAIYALTDYGIQASVEDVLPHLSAGNYYVGFDIWLDALAVYLEAYRAGAPIDGNADLSGSYPPGKQDPDSPSFLLSLAIGLAVGGITVLVMRSSMNTKRSQRGAASYLASGTYQLRTHQDIFLYSNVTKTPKPKETASGGGSSVHRSSSGRRHGGGGGKF